MGSEEKDVVRPGGSDAGGAARLRAGDVPRPSWFIHGYAGGMGCHAAQCLTQSGRINLGRADIRARNRRKKTKRFVRNGYRNFIFLGVYYDVVRYLLKLDWIRDACTGLLPL